MGWFKHTPDIEDETLRKFLSLSWNQAVKQFKEWRATDSWPDDVTKRYGTMKFVDMNQVINGKSECSPPRDTGF